MAEYKSIENVTADILAKLQARGVPEGYAKTVAESLAFADARGTRSHGMNMLDAYLERIDSGGIDIHTPPAVIREDGSTIMMDGNNGFGQVGVSMLMEKLYEKAQGCSIVNGSIRRINHSGALAYYTLPAALKGYIALLFVNANPSVAPFGGMEAVLGTNPISIAIPNGESPIVLDMASSAAAKARIYRAAKLGEKIDPSWALDADGNPTDDPEKALQGVLCSMAGPKGYGLALVVEVLAGVLSGGGITSELSSVHKQVDKGMNAAAFAILIDAKAFLGEDDYTGRMGQLTGQLKGSKPQPGKDIYLPGELEQLSYQKAVLDGIEY